MKEENVWIFQQHYDHTVDISVNMFLETHMYSHLNKNKVNTKM